MAKLMAAAVAVVVAATIAQPPPTVSAMAAQLTATRGVTLTIVQHGRFPIPPSGTFESGPPFCPSGTWRDTNDRLSGTQVTLDRVHTCDDGSGTIVVRSTMLDHFRVPALSWTGSGRIIGGTGRYVHLRGVGTIGGVEHDPIAFTDTWQGLADFDDVAPAARIGSVGLRRLQRPKGTFALRVTFSARDDVAGNAVAYDLRIGAAARTLARRRGTVSSGAASLTFARIRPPATVRRLWVSLTVSDPLENRGTTRRTLGLPRR